MIDCFDPSRGVANMVYAPGETAPETGRYECSGCGNTIIVHKGDTFGACGVCCSAAITWTLVAKLT